MKITPDAVQFLRLLGEMKGHFTYAKIRREIIRNRLRFQNQLPKSDGMIYKRKYEFKRNGYIESQYIAEFPARMSMHLTQKALDFIKTLPLLVPYLTPKSPLPLIPVKETTITPKKQIKLELYFSQKPS